MKSDIAAAADLEVETSRPQQERNDFGSSRGRASHDDKRESEIESVHASIPPIKRRVVL